MRTMYVFEGSLQIGDHTIDAATGVVLQSDVPVEIVAGHYRPPAAPGTGAAILLDARNRYRFPDGPVWTETRSLADPSLANSLSEETS